MGRRFDNGQKSQGCDTDAGRAAKQVSTYLSGKDAKATKNGVIKLLRGMNVKTITFDNGKEFAYHEDISKKLRSEIYFAHPYTSYERGLNEYTNRLLRQYFPKGMDLRKATEREHLH